MPARDAGMPIPDANGSPDTSSPGRDAGVTFNLTVIYSGYDSFRGQDMAVWLQDTTTAPNGSNVGSLVCGGGSFVGTDGASGLVPGHTYAYDYWLSTNTSQFCFGYPVPPYHAYEFGPVTGDTMITVTPSDPVTN
jgi:hypothetical protein